MPESDYQAKYDAQTLAQANVIRSDPSRLSAAQSIASKLAEEKKTDAKAMQSVAKGSQQRQPRRKIGDGNFFDNMMKK